jgi:uncharacterized protein YjbI with pentapeptide repeats
MDLVLIITIIGVIVAVISLYYSRKQTLVTENQASATQDRIDERFTQAIDHLVNDKLEIRLGAISALEIIANESNKYYWPIMEIFTAYIRKNSSIEDQKVREQNKVPLDIQAILTAIGRRKYFFDSGEFNSLDLQRSFMREVNLEGANLDEADFEGANLDGANLVGATLFGANLERAYLLKADLMGATLYGANLVGAKLFSATLYGANLKGANFAGTSLMNATLYGANLQEANLEGADLREANLERAYLIKANNLTIDQLSNVKTLYNAKLDEELEKPLREKYPALFEKPDHDEP